MKAGAKLDQRGDSLFVTTGPATIYWNPANTATGNYTISATFTEPLSRKSGTGPSWRSSSSPGPAVSNACGGRRSAASRTVRSRAVAELLSGAGEARVTCPRGTDLTLDLRGREAPPKDIVVEKIRVEYIPFQIPGPGYKVRVDMADQGGRQTVITLRRNGEARNMLEDVVRKYPGTPAAQLATDRLKRLGR